jgi:hypothetical protein
MRQVKPAVIVLAIGASGAAAEPPLDTTGASQCQTRGYAKDTDPKGTNIRRAPRAEAAIIGHLAPLTRVEGDTWAGVEFDIVGAKDGWLLIRNPEPPDGLKLDPAHVGDGRGWISGRLVGTQLAARPFRAAPRCACPGAAVGRRLESDQCRRLCGAWLRGQVRRGHRHPAQQQAAARLVVPAVLQSAHDLRRLAAGGVNYPACAGLSGAAPPKPAPASPAC